MSISLESVERNYVSLNKSGVDEALCPVENNHLARHSLHKLVGTGLVRNLSGYS